MNELTPAQRERILARLREGRSLRQIQSETGHRRETIARYGRRAGLLPEPRRTSAAEPRNGGSQCRCGRGTARRHPARNRLETAYRRTGRRAALA